MLALSTPSIQPIFLSNTGGVRISDDVLSPVRDMVFEDGSFVRAGAGDKAVIVRLAVHGQGYLACHEPDPY